MPGNSGPGGSARRPVAGRSDGDGGVAAGSPRRTGLLIAAIALSTPLALALESGLRQLVFPPEFEELRALVGPAASPWAWLGPVAVGLTVPVAVWMQPRLARHHLARRRARGLRASEDGARFEALMIATSLPQIPAVAATLAFMFGSAWPPVVATVAASTVGVLVVGTAYRKAYARKTR